MLQTRTSSNTATFQIQRAPTDERTRFVAERTRTRHERARAPNERQFDEQLDRRVWPRYRFVANGNRERGHFRSR